MHPSDNPKCPKCGSADVMVGSVVLSCNACDWHYLNEFACRVCGQPARYRYWGQARTGAEAMAKCIYACREHPFTADEMQALREGRDPPKPPTLSDPDAPHVPRRPGPDPPPPPPAGGG